MTSTYRARAADQRVADEIVSGQDLMCAAAGCPHRWSVDAGAGKLCSWHAWESPNQWPRITQERLDALATRAMRAQTAPPPAPYLTLSQKKAILRDLGAALRAQTKKGRKDWALAIVKRSEAGERISPLVLRMAQAVANKPGVQA